MASSPGEQQHHHLLAGNNGRSLTTPSNPAPPFASTSPRVVKPAHAAEENSRDSTTTTKEGSYPPCDRCRSAASSVSSSSVAEKSDAGVTTRSNASPGTLDFREGTASVTDYSPESAPTTVSFSLFLFSFQNIFHIYGL
jgi:hypothetical protein